MGILIDGKETFSITTARDSVVIRSGTKETGLFAITLSRVVHYVCLKEWVVKSPTWVSFRSTR